MQKDPGTAASIAAAIGATLVGEHDYCQAGRAVFCRGRHHMILPAAGTAPQLLPFFSAILALGVPGFADKPACPDSLWTNRNALARR